jgi:hypothetical protein
MNQTPPKVVYLVISILGVLALIGVSSLSATMFWKNYADPAVLTAIISITSGLVGSLGTVLVSTRTQPTSGDTKTSTTIETSTPAPSQEPQQVVITNELANPVPVTER